MNSPKLAAEFTLGLRYFVRRRAVWIWMGAVLIWPLCYLLWLGGRGTSPMVLAINLAILPVTPILLGFVGAQLTDMLKAHRAPAIFRAWPVPPWLHTGAPALLIILIALASTVITNGINLALAPPALWQNGGWVITTVMHGLMIVGLTDLLWLSGGYLLGQWVNGFWKLLVVILAPAAWLMASLVVQDTLSNHGLAGAQLFSALEVSPLAWLAGRVSAIWGFGPYNHIFWLLAIVTACLDLLWLSLAGAFGFGLDRYVSVASFLLIGGALTLGVTATTTLDHADTRDVYGMLADSFHAGHPSPVTLLSASVTIHRLQPHKINAAIAYVLKPRDSLHDLRFFLNPALRVTSASVNGRAVGVSQGSFGWSTLQSPLQQNTQDVVKIHYQGDPDLAAAMNGSANWVAFVSSRGLLLPGGSWYPLVGLTGKAIIPWSLSVEKAPPYTLVTSLGRLSPSLQASRKTANNLALVGGRLDSITFHGIHLYVAAEERATLRNTLTSSQAPTDIATSVSVPSIVWRLNSLLGQLAPKPQGSLVWPLSSNTPPYTRTIDPVIAEMWPQGYVNGSSPARGVISALNEAPSEFSFSIYNHFSRSLINLWLTQGNSSAIPTGTPLNEVVNSVLDVEQGGTNGTLDPAIVHLDRQALPKLLMEVRAQLGHGSLSQNQVNRIVQSLK